ncbi:MAG: class I adenylate-forming enzyme family protein [Pseudomonadota bacterium]
MEGNTDTLANWLDKHALVSPEAPALMGPDGAVSYGDLARKVRATAFGLQQLGLGKGDVVALQLPNIEAFVVAFLAVTKCGGIAQTLHMPYRQAELKHLLGHSGARIAVGLSSFKGMSPAAEMLAMQSSLPALESVVAVGKPIPDAQPFSAWSDQDTEMTLPDVSPDDPYLLLYTSGTTASPKGVPHTYRGFLGNAARSAAELGIEPGETMLSVAPYTHLYGLFVMHMCLATGAAQSLLPAFDPAGFLDYLSEAKPDGIFAAPAHFAPFCAAGAITGEHLAHTRFTCLSGSTVPPSLAEEVDTLMPEGRVIQLWGMSELQAGAFGRPDDPEETRFRTAGRASPATHLRIVDGQDKVLPSGQEGELQVKGPSVFTGYLNNRAETEAAFVGDGWFRTGDLAILDRDGFLTLTGRLKEIINRGGVKYNPVDIEAVLSELDAVEACAIVPFPDPDLGERACLCVQLRDGKSLTLGQAAAVLEERGIAKYKWPERLEIVDAMPLTPTRKIMRGSLQQRIADSMKKTA